MKLLSVIIVAMTLAFAPLCAFAQAAAQKLIPLRVAYDGYSARYPNSCGGGYWARRPIYDRWGNLRGYSRPRFICPSASRNRSGANSWRTYIPAPHLRPYGLKGN